MKVLFCIIALLLAGGAEISAASSSGSKPKTVSSSKKNSKKRKNSKNSGNRRQQVAVMLKQEFKTIFYLQKRMLKNNNSSKKSVFSNQIKDRLKRISPHLKQLGKLPCIDLLCDVEKTVEEARKALPEAAEAGNTAVIDMLHQHYINIIEAYKKDKL